MLVFTCQTLIIARKRQIDSLPDLDATFAFCYHLWRGIGDAMYSSYSNGNRSTKERHDDGRGHRQTNALVLDMIQHDFSEVPKLTMVMVKTQHAAIRWNYDMQR